MLKERTEILLTAGIISTACADYVNQVIDLLEPLTLSQDKLEMFTTHLAMATERMIKGETVDSMDDAIYREVEHCASFEKASTFFKTMITYCPVVYPVEEERFLLMHLCNLFQQ